MSKIIIGIVKKSRHVTAAKKLLNAVEKIERRIFVFRGAVMTNREFSLTEHH